MVRGTGGYGNTVQSTTVLMDLGGKKLPFRFKNINACEIK
jgi:hypothetical protein